MKKKRLETSLTEALNEAHCAVLPSPVVDSKNSTWAQAIVKVTKCDMTENYALAINNGQNVPVIVKDYGSAASIVKIDGIYPYSFIDERSMPNLRNKSEISAFLVSYGYNPFTIKSILSNKDANGKAKTDEQRQKDMVRIKEMLYRVCINDLVLRTKNKKHIEDITKYKNEQEEIPEGTD